MKNKFNSIKIILTAVLFVILAAMVAVYIFAGSAVKIGIEVGATKALKVGVTVENVDLSILRGRIGLQGLVINNPAGYQYPTLLEIKDARAAVAIGSLLSDKIEIKEVKLDGINLVIEQKGLTNNLKELINNISKGEKDKAATKSEGGGKKLQIDELEITNVAVKVKLLPIPGKSDTVELKLSPIRMTNLGSDSKMDMTELSSKVMVAIASGVAEQGAGILPEEITGSIKSGLKGIKNLGGEALDEGGKMLKEGVDIGKDVTEGIQGLFKQKKSDK